MVFTSFELLDTIIPFTTEDTEMKFIVRKKVGSVTVQVDPQDAHLLRSFVWTVNVNETGQTYLRRTQNGVTIALHRDHGCS